MIENTSEIKLREKLLKKTLDLSYRITMNAPPMKPFVRFSNQGDAKYKKNGQTDNNSNLFWDFEDALQKILLKYAKQVASPGELFQMCTNQWKTNLTDFYTEQKQLFEAAKRKNVREEFGIQPRQRLILEKMAPGNSFLYIGCGAGQQCLAMAQNGLDVTGIDSDPSLVDLARRRAEYAGVPFQAVCMDFFEMTFEPSTFDGLLMEFYSFVPSSVQAAAMGKLGEILKEDGKGFLVGVRKKYTSFFMNSQFPPAMRQWLNSQQTLDFMGSQADNCEERLVFGLYNKSHTDVSFSAELDGIFDVVDCGYEENDGRYVVSQVRRKTGSMVPFESGNSWENEFNSNEISPLERHLDRIEDLCRTLEVNTELVTGFFSEDRGTSAANPLEGIKTDVSGFIEMLRVISREDES